MNQISIDEMAGMSELDIFAVQVQAVQPKGLVPNKMALAVNFALRVWHLY